MVLFTYRAIIVLVIITILAIPVSASIDDSYTKSLFHFDGNFTDESGKVWINNNSVIINTTYKVFGSGAGDWSSLLSKKLDISYSPDFDMGNEDFTIDFWYSPKNTTPPGQSVGTILCLNETGTYAPLVIRDTAGAIQVRMASDPMESFDVVDNALIGYASIDTWAHYAVVRNGTSFKMYQNGILQNTVTSSLALGTSGTVNIGAKASGSYIDALIDEMRISKGIARWTGNFTPPTGPYNSSWPYTVAGTYYWTCPAGVTSVSLSMNGGGGSGHGGWDSGGYYYPGGGGDAGTTKSVSRITVIPFTVYTIVVGAGGANASYNEVSHDGTDSTAFGYTGAGGAGGIKLYSGTTGGDGGDGIGSSRLAENGTSHTPFTAGVSGLGSGAGGGGGSSDNVNYDTTGGAGADGTVVITSYGYGIGNLPDFEADVVTGIPGTLVHFSDLSNITVSEDLTYNWSFGDGSYSSTEGNVVHVYSYTGVYDVGLTLDSIAGEITETKPSYIVISNERETIDTSVPRSVTLTCIDVAGNPLQGLTITATPLNFTAPEDWIETYYEIDSAVVFNGTTLTGLSGSDGSWAGPMLEAYLYNFTFYKEGDVDYAMTFYPSSTSYIIRVPTSGIFTRPTPASDYISYLMYNTTVNDTTEVFNVTYTDTSGGTSVINLTVRNESGIVLYTGGNSGFGTSPITLTSGNVTHGPGETYSYSFSAVQAQVGFVNQTETLTWEGLKTLSGFPDWVSQWLGVSMLVILAGIFGAWSVKYAVVILPVFTWFMTWELRWLSPAVSLGTFGTCLGILTVIGVLKYMREQERKV